MCSVKLQVKKHNVSKKDGKTSVYVQYYFSRDKRIPINTDRRIELKFWDFENDVLRRRCYNFGKPEKDKRDVFQSSITGSNRGVGKAVRIYSPRQNGTFGTFCRFS